MSTGTPGSVPRALVIFGSAVAATSVLMAGPIGGTARAYARNAARPSFPLRHQAASALLRAAGIRWISSGHCVLRTRRRCTSFDGLRQATLSGVTALRERSRCPVVVSGGTETGHARTRHSHAAGYKLDVLPNRCLDRFIRVHYRRLRRRGDGAAQYRSPGRATFARESAHWDITFA